MGRPAPPRWEGAGQPPRGRRWGRRRRRSDDSGGKLWQTLVGRRRLGGGVSVGGCGVGEWASSATSWPRIRRCQGTGVRGPCDQPLAGGLQALAEGTVVGSERFSSGWRRKEGRLSADSLRRADAVQRQLHRLLPARRSLSGAVRTGGLAQHDGRRSLFLRPPPDALGSAAASNPPRVVLMPGHRTLSL